jgi:hypothetical protein
MGANTVAGAIFTDPIESWVGNECMGPCGSSKL